jgi:predicted aspartyl protease
MKQILIGVSMLLGFAACELGAPSRVEAPVDSISGAVPFEMEGPGGAALVVPVYLNGEGPHDFVLDTGATLTCVDEALADTLGLPEQTGGLAFGAGVGGSGRVRLVGLDSLQVGEARAFDLTACTLNLEQFQQAGLHVDGLIGLNFLSSFRVTLDFEQEVVVLQQP